MYYMMDVCHLLKEKCYSEPKGSFPEPQGILRRQSCQMMKPPIALLPPFATFMTPAVCKDEHPASPRLSPCIARLENLELHHWRTSSSGAHQSPGRGGGGSFMQSERSGGFS